jgi:ABC-type Zn2+ transport system substrate-binding protein/surface adhesin
MPPKHRQLNAPQPKLAGNAYKALVDLPEDESDSSFDGRDGKVDGTDGKSTVNAPQHVSAAETTAAASPQQTPTGDPPLHIWHRGLIAAAVNTVLHDVPMDCGPENHFQYSAASLCAVEQANIEIQRCLTTFEDNVYNSFHDVFGRLDSILTKMDTVVNDNTVLRAAYDTSKQETGALKAAVDTLS